MLIKFIPKIVKGIVRAGRRAESERYKAEFEKKHKADELQAFNDFLKNYNPEKGKDASDSTENKP